MPELQLNEPMDSFLSFILQINFANGFTNDCFNDDFSTISDCDHDDLFDTMDSFNNTFYDFDEI
ncbi:MAG: hypothetical protein IE909_10090 [Campylobacterales bacterium]|nr:hypothetical protein [Campylobacterales bacterium]